MPRKTTGNAKSNSTNSADWQKFDFAVINLSAEDKAKFKKLYSDKPTALLDELPDFAQNGYKFSVAWDSNQKCFTASMTCKEPSNPNFNYVLTSRSGDFWEALALGIYKTMHMCADEIWSDGQEEGTWG